MGFVNQVPKIVLTGGSGFLGTHLLNHEMFRDALVIGRTHPANHQYFESISFDSIDTLAEVFQGKDVVVHAAARAHVMKDGAESLLDEYRNINTVGTLNLATQAALAGVKRFIFISTIKVLGDQTEPGQAFKSDDSFSPQDPYSISKVEAEIGLKLIGEASGMEIVIIRPPLVYGQGVKGNFASLLKLARLSIPLPFGSIQNKRSLVSVENLVDLIVICLDHPNAKNQTFLVSDDDDMSTSALLSRLAKAGGYKAYLFKFPLTILNTSLRLLGKPSIYERLCGSMQVNIEYTKSQLSWKPPFKVKDSLSSCWLLDAKR
ncbi:NAD-dependent epimerase/dehydratase family protein [Pseudomonadales bacterium]|nr:NAD-dependent epimerase/dehydratase family protein [Pseudomonadales bacterium]